MSRSRDTIIRRFEDHDLAELGRLTHDTIDVSYAQVYPPRAVAFFKSFHSEEKILDRCQSGAARRS